MIDSEFRFWIMTQEPDFYQTSGLSIKLENHQYFHIKVKKVNMNILEFYPNPKYLIFWPFFWLLGLSWPGKIYFLKIGLRHYLHRTTPKDLAIYFILTLNRLFLKWRAGLLYLSTKWKAEHNNTCAVTLLIIWLPHFMFSE